jgi:hypothetical protein
MLNGAKILKLTRMRAGGNPGKPEKSTFSEPIKIEYDKIRRRF